MSVKPPLLAPQRNPNLDLLRLFGVFIIMIAHAEPPGWLFQLRNFGTPLLIVASALTYATIYKNKTLDTRFFIKKRLRRLVFPAWTFLAFFFVFFAFLGTITGREFSFTNKQILESFTFYDGIGYVWIFKVYIFLSLITPFALKLTNRNIPINHFFITLICLYLAYEVALSAVILKIPGDYSHFINTVILVLPPYAALYFYGFRLSELSDRTIGIIIAISLAVFVIFAIYNYQNGLAVSTQHYKYPPRLYYLSYAFFALNCLYLLCRKIDIKNVSLSRMIIWLSSNSLWIYLWHILALFLWEEAFGESKAELLPFMLKCSFIFSFGVILARLQSIVVTRYLNREKPVQRQLLAILT